MSPNADDIGWMRYLGLHIFGRFILDGAILFLLIYIFWLCFVSQEFNTRLCERSEQLEILTLIKKAVQDRESERSGEECKQWFLENIERLPLTNIRATGSASGGQEYEEVCPAYQEIV
jgi:hypothetical protein